MQDFFAILGCGRREVFHAGTGPLGWPPVALASVGMMCYAKVRTGRRLSLVLVSAVFGYGEEYD